MYVIDANPKLVKENDYSTAKIEKFLTKKEMGLDDFIMGGNCSRIAKIKDKELYLLLDRSFVKTIAVATPKTEKKVEQKVEVKVELKTENEEPTCEKCGKTFKNDFALKAHMRFCKK